MKIICPRQDFVIVEDYFSAEQAAQWLSWILEKGSDTERGFHHPYVKPNRFHARPKYPVKKYMCLGLYWNPVDYLYYDLIPEKGVKPHDLPLELLNVAGDALKRFFPWENFRPQTSMVNFYTKDSSMGLHIDKDEEEKVAPVIGLNFGSTARFFYEDESAVMRDCKIPGNSIYIFGGKARLMRHGIGTNYAKTLSVGSEKILQSKERVNLTIRQVFKAAT